MKFPKVLRIGQKWINTRGGSRSYSVFKCAVCHELHWALTWSKPNCCSPKCNAKTRMKFNGLCKQCRKQIPRTSPHGTQFEPRKFCSNRCKWNHLSGKHHYKWKGGVRFNGAGYIEVLIKPCTYIREHRFIMEEFLGRKLKPQEIVHHINHNRLDNRIENLMLMSRPQHSRHHKIHRLSPPIPSARTVTQAQSSPAPHPTPHVAP